MRFTIKVTAASRYAEFTACAIRRWLRNPSIVARAVRATAEALQVVAMISTTETRAGLRDAALAIDAPLMNQI